MSANEIAAQTANMSIANKSWLEHSYLVETVNSLKDLCLGNCRLLYGSERFKFYDIVVCEDQESKRFCAVLTCNQDGKTKFLRTVSSECPVSAVRNLVDGLQKDTAKLFYKYAVGSQLEGQQGFTNPETNQFELWDQACDKRIPGPDDDTVGLIRSWSTAPGGSGKKPSRGPRNDGASGYDNGTYKRRAMDQVDQPAVPLNYNENP